jgi:hypothetical protein
MSGEMRRRTAKRIWRSGLTSRLLVPAQFLSGRLARHAAWAAAIAERFLQRVDRRGVARPTLVDLAIPRRYAIPSKHINRQSHQHHQNHRQAVSNVFTNTVIWQLLPRCGRIDSQRGRFDSKQPSGLRNDASRSLTATHLTQFATKQLPLNPSLPLKNHASDAESRPAAIGAGSPFFLLSTRRLNVPAYEKRMEYAEDSRKADVAARIARQHRRYELSRTEMAREPAPIFSPLPASRTSRTLERNISSPIASKTNVESSGAEGFPSRTAAPVVNVTLVADEVMKQLDRRLVAARERMGRI